jgi:hypothetical protein
LRGKLGEFDEVDRASVQTRISLHLELVDRKTVEVVQSLDRNLQHVVSEAADEIDRILAGRH